MSSEKEIKVENGKEGKESLGHFDHYGGSITQNEILSGFNTRNNYSKKKKKGYFLRILLLSSKGKLRIATTWTGKMG